MVKKMSILWLTNYSSCDMNFIPVAGISIFWQKCYSCGRNFNPVAGILILWQEFDSYGINFILSEKMRQFMRGFGFRIPGRHCVFPVYRENNGLFGGIPKFENPNYGILSFGILNFGIPNFESPNIGILNFGIQI